MTSKQQAIELVELFSYRIHTSSCIHNNKINAKESALIAVDQILKHCYEVMKPFWEEVKQEIKLL
jgi:hypothetical protein